MLTELWRLNNPPPPGQPQTSAQCDSPGKFVSLWKWEVHFTEYAEDHEVK